MKSFLIAGACIIAALTACSTTRKLKSVRNSEVAAEVSVADDVSPREVEFDVLKSDTLHVRGDDGKDILIMRAVKDENGDMVASDVIERPAVVCAKFKNVAERSGKVDLRFNVRIPAGMMDRKWQCRFTPVLYMLGDSLNLEPILVTGDLYRKSQLRGYQFYERFLSSIITDSTEFIRKRELEVFLKRNIPQLYSLKRDTTLISEERISSIYGITEKIAAEHYTNHLLKRLNFLKQGRSDEVFRKYVKAPIVSEGLRLDSLVRTAEEDFIYMYTQTIKARPKLKKAEIGFYGGIYQEDRKLASIESSGRISFYISSLSTLAENVVKYRTKVVERRVSDNSVCWIEFSKGSSILETGLSENASEMARIEGNILKLEENMDFDLDSIVVTASCSPEGSFSHNRTLSLRRSESVSTYFRNISPSVPFIPRNLPENWTAFDAFVNSSDSLPEGAAEEYFAAAREKDPDRREMILAAGRHYKFFRECVYPRLRTVKFDFYLHRKGMVKDTLVTTEVDSLYMKGLQAISDRDYERAVTILRPYDDINAAVACCAMDYNATALDILSRQLPSSRTSYLKAIIHSRLGENAKAVECYMAACKEDPSLVHRGNLDPEIHSLVSRYDLK